MKDPVIRHRMEDNLREQARLIRNEIEVYGGEFTDTEVRRLRSAARALEVAYRFLNASDTRSKMNENMGPKKVRTYSHVE